MWKVSLWMIPPILIKNEAMWVIHPFLFGVLSMLLMGRGFSNFLRLTLCFFAKSWPIQFMLALQSIKILVETSCPFLVFIL